MKRIFLVAISGGPCAGKTSVLSYVKEALEREGLCVFVIQEAATDLIRSGATYEKCNGAVGFQTRVLELQLFRENLYLNIADKTTTETNDIIILCDRGAVDCLAYLSDDESVCFQEMNRTTFSELLGRYNAVFYMVSVASGNKDNYSLESNEARFESQNEAVLLDKRFLELWGQHNYCKVIDYEEDFAIKIDNLLQSIRQFIQTRV